MNQQNGLQTRKDSKITIVPLQRLLMPVKNLPELVKEIDHEGKTGTIRIMNFLIRIHSIWHHEIFLEKCGWQRDGERQAARERPFHPVLLKIFGRHGGLAQDGD
ncbi:hypothetical protein Adt_18699 [Abeliophyllum distichum]|uniref:Uncharacterized protein n=1 Tax=Abeliophyllum distichum TaxID=126358 RepID=A0ABD1TK98_9LAMI